MKFGVFGFARSSFSSFLLLFYMYYTECASFSKVKFVFMSFLFFFFGISVPQGFSYNQKDIRAPIGFFLG